MEMDVEIPPKNKAVEADNNLLQLFPNPASDLLHIEVEEQWISDSGATLSLVDLLGRVVYRENLAQSEYQKSIDIDHLKNGVYLLTIETDNRPPISKELIILD